VVLHLPFQNQIQTGAFLALVVFIIREAAKAQASPFLIQGHHYVE
jgi:hypothetical protein